MSNLSTTSDEILNCAQKLIIAGGYNGFSYADIAVAVGIRKPSIHHHFPAKADLVRTLVARYRENAEASFLEIERKVPDAFELLNVYANYWEQCIEDASIPFCLSALLASELPVLPPEVAVEVRAYFRFLSTWLTAVMERGEQQGSLSLTTSPASEAETFMATIHGAMLSARAYGKSDVFGMVLKSSLERLRPR